MEDATSMMGSVSGSLALFAALFLITYVSAKALSKSKRRLAPSMRSLPIVGSAPFLPLVPEIPRFLLETSKRLGPVFSLNLGTIYAVTLNSKEVIHEALVKRSLAFAGRNAGYSIAQVLNVNLYGILAKQYGPVFRKYHQLTLNLLKEFGFGSGSMEQRIMTEAEELVTLIKSHNGKPLNPTQLFSMCALNVIASIIFGQRLSQTDTKLNDLAKQFHLFATSKRRYADYFPLLRFVPYFKKVLREAVCNQDKQLKFVDESIAKTLSNSEDSFVKLFTERLGASYDRNELRFICRDLLIAGSETTATSLLWGMVIMANNPDIQKRLQREIDSVVTGSRPVLLDDMIHLPYVEAGILELTRIKTIVPLALQHLTLEDTEVGGYFVPKNSVVIPNLYTVHMNPADWPEPEEYRPERFIDENGKVFGKERVIPFSLGKRSCTGEFLARQELFLFFTTLLQHFDILPPEGQTKVECQEAFVVTMGPTPFEIRLISR